MKISQHPTPQQLEALRASSSDAPVVMLNLLRFKERATAPDEGVSGQEAYERYGRAITALIAARGGRLIWSGRVEAQVIGEGAEGFHMAALVEYPSPRAFVEIATSPEVAEIGVHRVAGLEGQWLIATSTRSI